MTSSKNLSFCGIDNAPGQESPQEAQSIELRGEKLPGDKVAIVEPDYFANRKMAEF